MTVVDFLGAVFSPIAPEVAVLLIIASAITSFVTAAFGIGGGLALISLMAQLVPPAVLIPLHGITQAGSNIGRAALLRTYIKWHWIGVFCLGIALGSLIGIRFVVTLNERWLQLGLAGFILFMLWGPTLPQWTRSNFGIGAYGTVSSFLTLFIGATGPFIAAALKPYNLDPKVYSATFAAGMSVQHLVKIAIFISLGFSVLTYGPLLIGMLASGLVGTYLGTRLLTNRRQERFHFWLKIILSALAVRLVYRAVSA